MSGDHSGFVVFSKTFGPLMWTWGDSEKQAKESFLERCDLTETWERLETDGYSVKRAVVRLTPIESSG